MFKSMLVIMLGSSESVFELVASCTANSMGMNVAGRARKSAGKAKAKKGKAGASASGQAAAEMMPKSIFDQAHMKLEKKNRSLKRRDSDQQVKKIIYDHYEKTMTHEEIYVIERNGQTMHDRLIQDRKRWKDGEIVMGAKYHAALKAEYCDKNNTMNLLRPTNPDDRPDDGLGAALLALVESKSQNQQFVDWADAVPSVNNYNLIAIYRQAQAMPPSASQDNADFGLTVLGLVARLKLQQKIPAPFLLMRDYFDRLLQCSLSSFKSQGKSVSFWWKTTKHVASFILPEVEVDECMACEGKWADITSQVEIVFNSSEVGRQLMETPMAQVTFEKMSKSIDEHIANFIETDAIITAKALEKDRDEWIEVMRNNCFDHTKPFEEAKEVDCKYRQVCTKVVVTSPLDEYNIKMASAVRSLAVTNKLLKPMWCEDSLVPARAATHQKIEADVLVSSENLREAMHTSLSMEEATAPNIAQTLKQKMKFFRSIDNRSRIEISFWLGSIGDGAKERVQEAILACLPKESASVTLSDSIASLADLSKSKLLVFSGSSATCTWTLVNNIVKSIKTGSAPALDRAGDSSFMTKVKNACALFLSHPEAPATGAAAGSGVWNIMRGKEAAEARWAIVKGKLDRDEEVPYIDLSILITFGWLLDPEVNIQLKTLGRQVVAKRGSSASAPNAKKKKTISPAEAKDRVAMLFAR